ncbi:MAG: SMI1/KNR4 family protein [Sedimenticola thiotaurini]|uniref:SMI1/KNR4 family protein n=1 Tax=Sedimenticola thiotaurini TaxID=1543721 RepID=A0A558D2B1_9GAMM|nr:MAG: SMI1/KNR4 family protein [Sedimenticola thiotaurini]
MNADTLGALNHFFSKLPFMKAGTVSNGEIDFAENALGIKFATDYRVFISDFGGAMVGRCPIYGLRHAGPMDDNLWSVVDVTEHFRRQSWPGTDSWYIISMDHAGNPIGLDELGKVLCYDHDARDLIEVAPDFESYLLDCLKS